MGVCNLMIDKVNTLNGSLEILGETLATNISSKGVSASASDGLTTLANKVLDIDIGHSVSVKVVWVERDGDTSMRPPTINISLRENNIPVAHYILNPRNEWSATVYYLDASLTYTWQLQEVPRYYGRPSVDGDTTTVTYTKRVGPTPPGA